MSEHNPESEAVESEQQSNAPSAGTLLKQARENMGLSIELLSEQIKVPPNVLEAIEIDKVPKNLPDTFIRGYIRSYARKVGVDEAEVLTEVETVAAINKTTSQSDSGMQSFSRRNRRKASEKRLIYFTWFMVIGVIIAVVLWWWQDTQKSDYAPVVDTQPALAQPQTSTPAQDKQTNAEIEPLQQVEQTPVQSVDASVVEAEPVAPEATQQQATATEAEEVAEVIQDKTTANESTNNDPLALTEEQKALVADNGQPDESGFLKVEMQFDKECWVEVYDIAGERVAIGNKPAGYLMRLNAQGPLRVLLGNPAGVSIWVNDKVYDMSEHPKNRIAKFELEAI